MFLLSIIIPLAGAFLVACLKLERKQFAGSLLLWLTFLAAASSAVTVMRYGEIRFSVPVAGWFDLSFVSDGLSAFMAVVCSAVAFVISLYSGDYMKKYPGRGMFYFWMVFFVGSMMGLIHSSNLVLMYVFWEMTAVASWRLIGFYRGEKDLAAADKAFLVTFFGASVMLAGIAMVFAEFGTLELETLKGVALPGLVAFLFLAGIVSKSAQLPLQAWLPDAGVAPSPVTALLHAAVLVKIGVYVFARLFLRTFIPGEEFLTAVVALSVITILTAAGSALVSMDIKRILAYSTISQLGYIMLALALGSEAALAAALVYILAHSLGKAGLFLCAGIVEHEAGVKDIASLGGLMKTMPRTGLAYTMCAFSIIGMPPFLGFWPKLIIIVLTFQAGYTAAGLMAVAGALFTLFYLFRLLSEVFYGELRTVAREKASSVMVYSVLFFGAVSLLLGLLPKIPFGFINQVIK